jgi:hypothetical protein
MSHTNVWAVNGCGICGGSARINVIRDSIPLLLRRDGRWRKLRGNSNLLAEDVYETRVAKFSCSQGMIGFVMAEGAKHTVADA